MRNKPGKLLGYDYAVGSLKLGAHLLKERDDFFIVPGGRVTADTAQRIIARVDVVGDGDGLFEDTPQTWRIQS